ncbi:MAG TPA: MFS transporter [Gordonia polyisoprenivorans]|uniref:MFS transporter n=1 Tax=Gordonia polyisoprenivorans TaxID=84595 RepID=UPI00037BB98A|nr:MFS transporter [Gordonia polyisoprenivorans]QUD80975.1 MFS transporter [Gordonia polyisoprenivorans]HCS57931.1 MFS transporter [Gordonia polyisoprenivorans]
MTDSGRSAAPEHLGRSRAGVTAIFCLNGFLAALWVAHIPVITERTGTSHELLGGLLLLVGAAAFVGMQVCGHLIDRVGSRPTTIAAAVVLCPAMLGPVLATDPVGLACALALFGFANGSLDVSMNAQAVVVERIYRRPIMSAFHGFFSVGGLLGSGAVALGLWMQWPVVATVAVLAGIGLVVVAVAARGIVARGGAPVSVSAQGAPGGDADTESPQPGVPASPDAPRVRWWREVDLRRLSVMAALAFVLMLAEGTSYDWSALHVVETFGTREAVGAIAFASFSAAMMVARFVVDPIAARVGPVSVVRGGAVIGAVGMVIVLVPSTPTTSSAIVAIIGWTIFGIGLAGLIPQIFTAAGNLTEHSSGRAISMVVGCGYLGMLAGPAIVGVISGHSSLRLGLTPVLVALAFAVVAAGVVAAPDRGERTSRV